MHLRQRRQRDGAQERRACQKRAALPAIDQPPRRRDHQRLDPKAKRGAKRKLRPAPRRFGLKRQKDGAEGKQQRREAQRLTDGKQPDTKAFVTLHRSEPVKGQELPFEIVKQRFLGHLESAGALNGAQGIAQRAEMLKMLAQPAGRGAGIAA